MSDLLEIKLLGGLSIRLGGEPVTGLATRKVEALLAYLACTGRTHPRDVLAGLFWTERPQARAMANLRVALSSLNRQLGSHVNITRDTATFDRTSAYWLDVEAFSRAIDRAIGQQVHETSRQPGEGLVSELAASLAEAVGLYRGDFLAGFYVRESRGFEEWVMLERERLRRMALQALKELVAWHLTRGEFPDAIDCATQLLGIDPLSEEGRRQMMLALAHSGERSVALEQYEICRRVLAEELGIEPSERTTALYERIRVAPFSLPHDLPAVEVPCPYKGLASFEPEDAAYFFGREALVREMAARLADSRFLAVVGPSGSGKSSVVRAGLLPAIGQGALPDSQDWQTVILTPGPHPLAELAARVSALDGLASTALLKELKAGERGLDLAVKRLLAGQPDHVRVLLVVDQFEEVFALCRSETERRRFIDALLHAAEVADSRTVVVPTIRADFYGHCASYPRLAARLQSDQVLVGPLSEDELGQVIERPADVVGLCLEPGLVETIASDVAGEPGALPLLSHALLETWQRRRGRVMTLAGYAETGGVAGAIAQTADTVFGQLSLEERTIARGIFLRLTELGEAGAQDTRRRITSSELIGQPEDTPAVEAVLKRLADARLITTGEDTVEVAHEVLIREWPLLRRWLEEDREGLRTHRHLTEAAGEWERWDRDRGELYRGARLALATEWAEAHADVLNPLEREFLAASQEAVRRREAEREARRQRELEAAQRAAQAERRRAEEQARATSRMRRLAGALAVVFLLAVGAAVFAMNQQRVAQTTADNLAAEVVVRSTAQAQAVAAQETAVAEGERAERQARLALSRQLAAQSLNHVDDHMDLALLLSLEAYRATDTVEARGSLLNALERNPQLTTFLRGHTDTVFSVAFSPDGKTLASGGLDNIIILWDTSTLGQGSGQAGLRAGSAIGQPLGPPLTGHTARVASLAFSPDGRTLASGSWDHTIILWDVKTGEPLGPRLAGHTERVTSVAFSPDGRTLASGSWDHTIILWDTSTMLSAGVATSDPLGPPLVGHTDSVRSVAFSPDGSMLASGGCGEIDPNQPNTRVCTRGEIRFWDVATRQPLGQPLIGHTNEVVSLAFSPDGQMLASGGSDNAILLWDTSAGPALSEACPEPCRRAEGLSAGTATRQPIHKPLAGHTNGVRSVAFSPDGKTLVSGSYDSTIRLWDTSTGRPIGQALTGHSGYVESVAFHPDGQTLASGGWDTTVILWDASALLSTGVSARQRLGQVLTGHTDSVAEVAFSPDGKTLASASYDNTAILWDADTYQPLGRPLSHAGRVRTTAFSPDGRTLATGTGDNTIILWDVSTGQPIGEPLTSHTALVTSLAFGPDGRTLASGSADLSIILWDTSTVLSAGVMTRQPRTRLTSERKVWVVSLAFSPDGRILASNHDNAIMLWDVATGQPLGEPLVGHKSVVVSVAFSPDGQTLASGGMDQAIILWDTSTLISAGVATVQPIGEPLAGHRSTVQEVAFNPDGQMLASGSSDHTIILWDVATRQPIGPPLAGHTDEVWSVAFSPDGKRLASASLDNTVIVWDLSLESWKERACRIANRNLTRAEWKQFLGDEPYQKTCPDLRMTGGEGPTFD